MAQAHQGDAHRTLQARCPRTMTMPGRRVRIAIGYPVPVGPLLRPCACSRERMAPPWTASARKQTKYRMPVPIDVVTTIRARTYRHDRFVGGRAIGFASARRRFLHAARPRIDTAAAPLSAAGNRRQLRGSWRTLLCGQRTMRTVATSQRAPCHGHTRRPRRSVEPPARSAPKCRQRRVTASSSPFAVPASYRPAPRATPGTSSSAGPTSTSLEAIHYPLLL